MKRTMKIATLLIALILCLACFSACGASADDGGFKFTKDGEGYSCTGIRDNSATSAVIPSTYQDKPVTSIGTAAFSNCSELASVTIPNSVKTIKGAAFSNCPALTSITIPEGVTTIEGQVFKDCTALKSVQLPSTVTGIGYEAFANCSALTEVNIPNSVVSLEEAFSGCSSLKYNEYNNGKYLGNNNNPHLFLCEVINAEATTFAIPSETKFIDYYAFDACGDIRINYSGSKAQWENVTWVTNSRNYTIHCTDGEITG